jgi:hypothetical protein
MVVPELTAYLRNEFGSGGQKWLVVMWVARGAPNLTFLVPSPEGLRLGLMEEMTRRCPPPTFPLNRRTQCLKIWNFAR